MTRPLLLGHRGARASGNIPENTLASFELSLQHGCDGFEFDVRSSADGVAVICHDPAVRGLSIERTLAADLELPTLDDALRGFATRAFLDIELKVSGLEAQTIAALGRHPPHRGYVVSSFLPEVLRSLHQLDPDIPLGLIGDRREAFELWQELPVAWLIAQVELVDHALVEQVQAAGKKIMVWTVKGAEPITHFAECGADAIIVDETELAAQILALR